MGRKTRMRADIVTGLRLCIAVNIINEYQQTRERYGEVNGKRERATLKQIN